MEELICIDDVNSPQSRVEGYQSNAVESRLSTPTTRPRRRWTVDSRLQPTVIGHRALVAEHGAVLDDRVAADVTVLTQNRAAHDRLLADAAVRPDDRVLDHGVLFDVALPPDDAVRADPRARLHNRTFVHEARSLEDGAVFDARLRRDPRG